MSLPWPPTRDAFARSIRSAGWVANGQLTAAAVISVAALATLILYLAVIRSGGPRGAIVIHSQQAPDTSAAAGARPLSLPVDAHVLRPGAALTTRLNVALDGSAPGEVTILARQTGAGGCDSPYVEIFAPRGGAWSRVFSADDPSLPYGAILPPAEAGAGGCFPQVRLFSAQPAAGASQPLLALAVAYADSSLRLTLIGWDSSAGQPQIRFDWRTGPNGRLSRPAAGALFDLSEDYSVPQAFSGVPVQATLGRLNQTVRIADCTASVQSRRLMPNCDRGRIQARAGSGTGDAGAPQLVLLTCSLGTETATTIGGDTQLSPTGITWADVEDGDNVQLEFVPASLEPEATGVLPVAATLTDFAAATRHRAGSSPAPRAAGSSQVPAGGAPPPVIHSASQSAPARAPVPRPQQPSRAAPAPAPRPAQAPNSRGGASAPSSGGSTNGATHEPPGVPAPAIPPPPAPRGVPGVAPAPVAPR